MHLPVVFRGAGLGVANTLITYPLDTIKVYSQVDSKYNFMDITKVFLLYKGCENKIFWNTVLSGLIFWIRDICDRMDFGPNATSATSGVFSSFLIHYSELNKIQEQLGTKTGYFDTLLFTVIKETIQSVVFFYIIYLDGDPIFVTFLSGLVTSFVIYPIDTIRTNSVDNKDVEIKRLYDGYSWYCLRSVISAFVIKIGSRILNLI